MSPRFVARIIIDALFAAGVVQDKKTYDKIKVYLDSIPGYMKATVEDYEEWLRLKNAD